MESRKHAHHARHRGEDNQPTLTGGDIQPTRHSRHSHRSKSAATVLGDQQAPPHPKPYPYPYLSPNPNPSPTPYPYTPTPAGSRRLWSGIRASEGSGSPPPWWSSARLTRRSSPPPQQGSALRHARASACAGSPPRDASPPRGGRRPPGGSHPQGDGRTRPAAPRPSQKPRPPSSSQARRPRTEGARPLRAPIAVTTG